MEAPKHLATCGHMSSFKNLPMYTLPLIQEKTLKRNTLSTTRLSHFYSFMWRTHWKLFMLSQYIWIKERIVKSVEILWNRIILFDFHLVRCWLAHERCVMSSVCTDFYNIRNHFEVNNNKNKLFRLFLKSMFIFIEIKLYLFNNV